ncbi:MAG: hypothetical protein WC993_00945 [Methanoculleus sp.]
METDDLIRQQECDLVVTTVTIARSHYCRAGGGKLSDDIIRTTVPPAF